MFVPPIVIFRAMLAVFPMLALLEVSAAFAGVPKIVICEDFTATW
jgi:hypothetical protein